MGRRKLTKHPTENNFSRGEARATMPATEPSSNAITQYLVNQLAGLDHLHLGLVGLGPGRIFFHFSRVVLGGGLDLRR